MEARRVLRRDSKGRRWTSPLTGLALLLCADLPARGQAYSVWTFDGIAPAPGAAPSQVGRSVASGGDLDGDGIGDVLLGGNQIVRVHSGGTGALVHSIQAPAGALNYGIAVAGVGDVDGDGLSEFAVGAPFTTSVLFLEGEVVLHSGATGAVLLTLPGLPTTLLGRSIAGPGDVDQDGVPDIVASGANLVRGFSGATGAELFGFSPVNPTGTVGTPLAPVGDFDGDGLGDFAVGSPQGGPLGLGGGPVTIRSGATGSVLLSIPAPGGYDFGHSIAALGDVDADGIVDLAVGAPQVPAPPAAPFGPGIVRVHSGATTALLFSFNGAGTNDLFGYSVAGPGDLDGDAVPDVVVGAPQRSSSALVGPGYVRAFSGSTGGTLFTVIGAAVGDGFGTSVAPAGDPNGDGVPDLLAGAPGVDIGGVPDVGRADVLSFVGIPPGGTVFGSGCPGSGGLMPVISVSGGVPDSAGNPAIAIHLSRALGGTVAVLNAGSSSTSWLGVPLPLGLGFIGLPACALFVSADVMVAVPTTGSGRASLSAPTPSDPTLSGAVIFLQWYVVDPGPALVPGAMSPGLSIVIA